MYSTVEECEAGQASVALNTLGKVHVERWYYMARCFLACRLGGSSSSTPSGKWDFLWNSKLPGKVKICVWRLIKGVVPTIQQLKRRRVVDGSICPVCQVGDESVLHQLKEYKFSKQVWALSNIAFAHWDLPVESVEER